MISDKDKKQFMAGKTHWLERSSDVEFLLLAIDSEFDNINGLNILDAGCAQGRDTSEIFNSGMRVTGIDSNEKFISEARHNHPDIQFNVGNIEDLPYDDEQFDVVYCVNTLFYTRPEESLPELERVLKSGGIVFITLDKSIFDMDKNKELHSMDVDRALLNFKNCKIISKVYTERVDKTPLNHKHFFYKIILRKN